MISDLNKSFANVSHLVAAVMYSWPFRVSESSTYICHYKQPTEN